MHLKNIALLKIAAPGEKQFRSVRIAPLYDAVTTRVFPNLRHDRMALKLNGKDDRLTRADFSAAARTMGIPVASAEAVCSELTDRLSTNAPKLQLPTFARRNAKSTRNALIALVAARARDLR
jgi:serine/threonine-protein kinase HipA